MPQHPYLDSSLSPEARTADLLARMTLPEKVGQLCQMDGSREPAERWIHDYHAGSLLHVKGGRATELQQVAGRTRLGIPLLYGIDAIHGHCFHNGATVFPTQLTVAASWNEALLEEMARITAREMAATGMHWTFSPVLCNGRDPRWGRMSETFGEDPLLIGRLALAMVLGYQGRGDRIDAEHVLACAKHYVAYAESIGGRDSAEAEVSRRKLLSLFLPPFEQVARAGCASLMAGYQAIDGVPMSAHKWLLRDVPAQWGYQGFVVTDWDNVGSLVHIQKVCETIDDAAARALEAGNHMIMNTPPFYEAALRGVESGRIPLALVDDAARRILEQKFRLGLFDERRYPAPTAAAVIGCAAHRTASLQAARESMVLLGNRNGTLPLSPTLGRIAVIGPNADDFVAQLGDWAFGPHRPELWKKQGLDHEAGTVTILQGIQARLGKDCEVVHYPGCSAWAPGMDDIAGAVETARGADCIILCLGDHPKVAGERQDRADLNLSAPQIALFTALRALGIPLVTVLVTGKPLCVADVAAQSDALLLAGNPGMDGGTAVAEVLFGDYNPHGKLTASWPRMVGQIPVYYNQLPGWHGDKYIDCAAGPLFPFGYGLSYTTFAHEDLHLAADTVPADGTFELSLTVRNTGQRRGIEVVQLYMRDVASSVITPEKRLLDYQRVDLEPGASAGISFTVPAQSLWLIDAECNKVVEPGTFRFMVGASSASADQQYVEGKVS